MPTYSFACIRCARVPSRVVTFGLAFYLNYLEFASVSLVLFHIACLKRRRCQLGKEHIDLWHSRWTLAPVLAYCHCFSFNACFLCVFLSREIGSNFQFRILLTCPMAARFGTVNPIPIPPGFPPTQKSCQFAQINPKMCLSHPPPWANPGPLGNYAVCKIISECRTLAAWPGLPTGLGIVGIGASCYRPRSQNLQCHPWTSHLWSMREPKPK
jgi:hypothetical protein